MSNRRKELLSVPKREWNEVIKNAVGVYVIPSGRKHDSGWACMDFVAELANGSKIRFGGWCDDVAFYGSKFRMDCEYPSRIIHIWNSRGNFAITHDVSSIDFVEDNCNITN